MTNIAKQLADNENLSIIGGIVTFFGFYVIAELHVLAGLLMVFSGFGAILVQSLFKKSLEK